MSSIPHLSCVVSVTSSRNERDIYPLARGNPQKAVRCRSLYSCWGKSPVNRRLWRIVHSSDRNDVFQRSVNSSGGTVVKFCSRNLQLTRCFGWPVEDDRICLSRWGNISVDFIGVVHAAGLEEERSSYNRRLTLPRKRSDETGFHWSGNVLLTSSTCEV